MDEASHRLSPVHLLSNLQCYVPSMPAPIPAPTPAPTTSMPAPTPAPTTSMPASTPAPAPTTSPTPAPTTSPSPAPTPSPTPAPTTVADTLVHLIAVVEEGGPSAAALLASWSAFRSTWPDRPFCVLKVSGTCSGCDGETGKLRIPAEMALDQLVISRQAMRDNGEQFQQSDWFDLCNLQLYASTTVALLVDLEPTFIFPPSSVEASFNLFMTRITSAGLTYVVADPRADQNYVEPFNRNFVS
jgi:hypothetical protein